METSQLPDIARRTDVISYALLAEINHFHSERAVDFRLAMQQYLKEQIAFYQKVCKLCSAAQTGTLCVRAGEAFQVVQLEEAARPHQVVFLPSYRKHLKLIAVD
jgi:hypothetical protein